MRSEVLRYKKGFSSFPNYGVHHASGLKHLVSVITRNYGILNVNCKPSSQVLFLAERLVPADQKSGHKFRTACFRQYRKRQSSISWRRESWLKRAGSEPAKNIIPVRQVEIAVLRMFHASPRRQRTTAQHFVGTKPRG